MSAPPAADIDLAAHLLLGGNLVAFPTETVYGLGGNAADPAAVARIFAAKGRPADHPVIVHVAGADYLSHWARDIPDLAWELAEAFWPGPLTLILPRRPEVSDLVTGGQDTVGVRVPGHPVALELLRAFAALEGRGGGIAGPSANRFGRISPTTAEHVREELGEGPGSPVSLILDGGPCPVGIESTILDLSGPRGQPPRLLRPGHISPETLAEVIGEPPVIGFKTAPPSGTPRVSGSLDAHYAPATAMRVVPTPRLLDFLNALRHGGQRCGVIAHSLVPQAGMPHVWRMLPANPKGYAREIYAALREMDHAGVDLIVLEALPEGPTWAAVADRLRRSVAGSGAGLGAGLGGQ